MPNPKVVSLAEMGEPDIHLSPHYPGRFSAKPDKSFITDNAPELALNLATDNFKKQIAWNSQLLEGIKALNERIGFMQNFLIAQTMVVGFVLCLIVWYVWPHAAN